jgi:hypothetical protein
VVIKYYLTAGETISGMDTGISMGCAKKCHAVESVGIPFYNVVNGIKGGDAALRRGRCRIIPKREAFSK